MWVYDLDLWLWRSPRLSARVPSANFGDYSFSIYGLLEQHSSDWSRDLATLTFDLRGHGACGWCGSSSSIQVLSSYALPFGRYGAWCVSALMGLVTLTFDLLTLKLVCESYLRWGTFFSKFAIAQQFWRQDLCRRRTKSGTVCRPISYGQFRQLLKTFLFGQWGHGAV